MINELRDLRKEYKLQEQTGEFKDGYSTFNANMQNTKNFSDQQSNITIGFGNTQRMTKGKTLGLGQSVAESTHFNSKRNSRFKSNT